MTEELGLDARILAAATRRGRRLMTTAELLGEGATYRQIEYRIAIGRWRRLHRDVVDVGAGPLTRLDRIRAAVLVGAVASHLTALWLYGLGDFAPAWIQVSVLCGRRSFRMSGVTVYRRRALVRPRLVQGILCTSIEQTLLDVASVLPATSLHLIFTRAWRKRLTTPRRMLRFLDEHAGRGVAGSAKLRKVVAMYDRATRPPGSDYEAELLFLLLPALKRAGIEAPTLQYSLKIFDGQAEATIDLAWPERRKALEVMGLDTHGDYEAQHYDYERGAEIRARRWDLLEVAPKAIRERPEATVRRIIAWLREPAPPVLCA